MGKNQHTLSIPNQVWATLEKELKDNQDVLKFWNIQTVSDLFRTCITFGIETLQQNIAEFRRVHKMTMENDPKR